jgi:hypothetical protein
MSIPTGRRTAGSRFSSRSGERDRDLVYREIPGRPKRVPAAPVVRPKPPKYTPPPTHPWRLQRLSERSPSAPEGI